MDDFLKIATDWWLHTPVSGISPVFDRWFLFRATDAAPPKKVTLKYQDDTVAVCLYHGKSEKTIGFGLHLLQDRPLLVQDNWIQIFDSGANMHSNPKAIVDLNAFRMLQFSTDGDHGTAYWLSIRRKDTCL